MQYGCTLAGADSHVAHVVERTGEDAFAFTTCNPGQGREYHPADASAAPKIKHKPALRLDGVPRARLLDPAFLSLLLSQRIEGEKHKVEVIDENYK